MHLFNHILLASVVLGVKADSQIKPKCTPFPPSMIEYSAQFQEPQPPLIQSEFETSFIQHKWNQNLSHITSGYIYNSPSQNLVRADEAYNGGFGSSLFNYHNTTEDGLVDNIMTTYNSTSANQMYGGGGASFGGLVQRNFVDKKVASVWITPFLSPSAEDWYYYLLLTQMMQWDIMYQGTIPVTIYVTDCNIVVGYDFFAPFERTYVTTSFFNTYVGPVKIEEE
ncbi:hypothetical protein F5884DRAFT_753980 [Xylogone sp. PMI_703]|nr:hypothetical protein F5884DRAFT_753980 [Xylogone sp. PMI_703]